ncbi:HlyD family secretion protein [Consotaella aegiceratis]|uniref:HlyD family secretion protein n=1 Tax=Consotaella aegiceratis TaxID=3097961 RepID=UPI002F42ACBF
MGAQSDAGSSSEIRPAEAAPRRESGAEPPRAAETADAKAPRKGRRWVLMFGLPLLLVIVGGYFYVTGGRFINTEDAYVQQDRVTVMPQISGQIVKVGVRENEFAEQGSLLFAIDRSTFQNAVEQDEAAVASARLDVEKMKSAYRQAEAQRETAQQALDIALAQQKRQADLAKRGIVSQSALDQANLTQQQDQGALSSAEQALASAKAALAGNPDIPTDQHPEVMAALAELHAAQIDLDRTRVYAPADGIVSQTDRLQVGQYVTPSTSVLSLVETETSWVEANYKETDLTHMRPGQSVDVSFDAYPDSDLKGVVDSIGAGTGSEFSLIPAQNATGNWVKVVQRVPVRIRLEDEAGDTPPLRIGMSASVTVDTGHARGLPNVVTGALAALGIGEPESYAAVGPGDATVGAAAR